MEDVRDVMGLTSLLFFFFGLCIDEFKEIPSKCHSTQLAFDVYTNRVGPPLKGA